jgi:hypothetical protein
MSSQELSLVGSLIIALGIILVLIAWSPGAAATTSKATKLLF